MPPNWMPENRPAQRLPHTHIGTFTQALYDEAKKNEWRGISMKNDWSASFHSRYELLTAAS